MGIPDHLTCLLKNLYVRQEATIRIRHGTDWYKIGKEVHEGSILSPYGSDGKESACNAEDPSLILGLGRSSGEKNSITLQYSCLENSMDREAWWTTVHGATKSQIRWRD